MPRTCNSTPNQRQTQSFQGFEVALFAAPEVCLWDHSDVRSASDFPVFAKFTNVGDVPLTVAYTGPWPLLAARISEVASQDEVISFPAEAGQGSPTRIDLAAGASWTCPRPPEPLKLVLGQVRDMVSLRGGHPIRLPPGVPREIDLTLRLRAVVASGTQVQPVDTTFSTQVNVFRPARTN